MRNVCEICERRKVFQEGLCYVCFNELLSHLDYTQHEEEDKLQYDYEHGLF